MIALAGRRRSGELLLTLVERQLRLRSKRSMFGVVWPIVAPLFLFALYSFVFSTVFDVPIPRYGVFLFAGLLPWAFLAQTVGQAVSSISVEAELVRRAPFRHELLPISVACTMVLHFAATLVGFVVYLAVRQQLAYELLPLLIVPSAALLLLVCSIAMVVSLIDVYNRDLRQVLGNLMTIWFFLVPIVYRHEMAPERLTFLRSVDPMNMIVGQFRAILYHGEIARAAHMALMLLVCTVIFGIVLAAFRRVSPRLPKDV